MSRFKRKLKEPFGKAGLTVAILALVLAMVGGAYAAGGLTKAQEKQVTKIAKKYAGKPGVNGANGASGAPGAKGETGPAGAAGANGASVTTSTATSTLGGECPTVGGVKITSASGNTKVCNGKEGAEGTFGGTTLPEGKSLSGHWAASGFGEVGFGETGAVGQAWAAVSYALPLEAGPTFTNYIEVEGGEGEAHENVGLIPSHCMGTAENPQAVAGNLCIFAEVESNVAVRSPTDSDARGFTVRGLTAVKGPIVLVGAWAVTAEE